MCFRFANFSSFYVLIGGQICLLRTANKLPNTQPFTRPRAKFSDKSNHEHNIFRYMAYIRVIPTHSLYKWDLRCQLTCFLGLLKSGIVLETKSPPQFHILATWSFESFSQEKAQFTLYSSNGTLKSLNGVYILTEAQQCFAFSYF